MLQFILIFYSICLVLFIAMIWIEKINQKRAINSELDRKVTGWIKKTDPYFDFLYNLFGWGLAVLVIYYIYLG